MFDLSDAKQLDALGSRKTLSQALVPTAVIDVGWFRRQNEQLLRNPPLAGCRTRCRQHGCTRRDAQPYGFDKRPTATETYRDYGDDCVARSSTTPPTHRNGRKSVARVLCRKRRAVRSQGHQHDLCTTVFDEF